MALRLGGRKNIDFFRVMIFKQMYALDNESLHPLLLCKEHLFFIKEKYFYARFQEVQLTFSIFSLSKII